MTENEHEYTFTVTVDDAFPAVRAWVLGLNLAKRIDQIIESGGEMQRLTDVLVTVDGMECTGWGQIEGWKHQ